MQPKTKNNRTSSLNKPDNWSIHLNCYRYFFVKNTGEGEFFQKMPATALEMADNNIYLWPQQRVNFNYSFVFVLRILLIEDSLVLILKYNGFKI